MKQRLEEHDRLWLRCKLLLKEGTIPLFTFDTLTRRRIDRILRFQEEILEEQKKAMDEERRKQDREMKKQKY